MNQPIHSATHDVGMGRESLCWVCMTVADDHQISLHSLLRLISRLVAPRSYDQLPTTTTTTTTTGVPRVPAPAAHRCHLMSLFYIR